MKEKNTKQTKQDSNTTTADRDAFAVYCNLLHGWFKQPERFEQFAARCAELAKVAVKVAKENGIA